MTNRRIVLAAAVLAVAGTAPSARSARKLSRIAPVSARSAALPRVPKLSFTDYRLPNGLRVLLSRDTTAPVVSTCVTYSVGGFVEPAGHTGFAHLFEHLMFQGSRDVGKSEHDAYVVENGGTMNGGTGFDSTNYWEVLPANQLPLALFLEANRMGYLDVTQANLDNQRNVVQEERRMRYDNQPYGTMFERLVSAVYKTSPYGHTPIGSMADLDRADLNYVRSFYRAFYAPDNATLSIVGDFDEAKARALVQKYFGVIPRGAKRVLPSLAEPPQTKERRVTYTDKLAPLPAYVSAYRVPNISSADGPALSVLSSVLSGGKSSRLWQSLVEKQQVCTSADAGSGILERGPDLFVFDLSFGPGQSVQKAEEALDREIARVRSGGVTAEEVRTAKVQALRSAISRRRQSISRAMELGRDASIFGDPNRANTELARIDAVTPSDVQRVARKYLVRSARTVVIAQPEAKPTAATGGTAR